MGNNIQTEEKPGTSSADHTRRNFILKVVDAGATNIKKILKEQGIEVISIQEIYKEAIESQS